MDIDEFERAVRDRDFAVGDSFWIYGIEFEVTCREDPPIE